MAAEHNVARSNYVHIIYMDGLRKSLAGFSIEIKKEQDTDKYAFFGNADGRWPVFLEEDESKNPKQFCFSKNVMPYVKEGEILITMESTNEGLKYIGGSSAAFIRKGTKVSYICLELNDIYGKAAKEFKVDILSLSRAEY